MFHKWNHTWRPLLQRVSQATHVRFIHGGPVDLAQWSRWPHWIPLCEPTQWFYPFLCWWAQCPQLRFLYTSIITHMEFPNPQISENLVCLLFPLLVWDKLIWWQKVTRQDVSIYMLHEWGIYALCCP